MPVALLPRYSHAQHLGGRPYAEPEPLDTGPSYVRSRDATRWHRPRHGHRYANGRVSYTYWCGANYGEMGVEELPAGDLLCGTCEGRFQAQTDQTLTFTPMTHRPPAWCPASRRDGWFPEGYRTGRFDCLVCGADVTGRAMSSYYTSYAVTRHKPGPRLVAPCRFHGWNFIVRRGDEPVCACEIPPQPDQR